MNGTYSTTRYSSGPLQALIQLLHWNLAEVIDGPKPGTQVLHIYPVLFIGWQMQLLLVQQRTFQSLCTCCSGYYCFQYSASIAASTPHYQDMLIKVQTRWNCYHSVCWYQLQLNCIIFFQHKHHCSLWHKLLYTFLWFHGIRYSDCVDLFAIGFS